MATTTMQRVRAWRGPAVFSFGFRPFFLGATVYAAGVMVLWVSWLQGRLSLPSGFDPIAWHSHELLFGYVPAVVAGFLLTAVPNWTGRLPVVGWPLAGLFALWVVGRIAVAASVALGPAVTAAISLAFPVCLAAVIAREIIAGKNWRNLKVLAVLLMLTAAQAWFHSAAAAGHETAPAARAALAAVILLITIIGGRIVPSFTTNWLKRANPGRLPAPVDRLDRLTLAVTAVALAAWAIVPAIRIGGGTALPMAMVAGLLLAAGGLNLLRQLRWAPDRTFGEALVTVLHIGYAFVPLGFLLCGVGVASDRPALGLAGLHAWGVGAIGLMTLAVMTRASRGHTGRPLTAPMGTIAIYAAMVVSAICRIAAALAPEHGTVLLAVAASAWSAAFLGFVLVYGPMLLTSRAGPR